MAAPSRRGPAIAPRLSINCRLRCLDPLPHGLMSPSALQLLIAVLHVVLAVGVSAHIVLTKDDVRAAIGWIGLVWLTPLVGSLMYLFLGVNRIKRLAGQLRRDRAMTGITHTGSHILPHRGVAEAEIPERLRPLATLTGRVTGAPLVGGNAVDPLVGGDAGYPAMLEAIADARTSVALATYIFDRGTAADRFVDALAAAAESHAALADFACHSRWGSCADEAHARWPPWRRRSPAPSSPPVAVADVVEDAVVEQERSPAAPGAKCRRRLSRRMRRRSRPSSVHDRRVADRRNAAAG